MLASSYQWSADKKSIVFTVRDNVKWSDGQPFSAADVAFTFNLMKQNPVDRPVRTVDRCRAAECRRERQQGHDDLREAGRVVLLPVRQPGRHRAAAHLDQRRPGGAPGHLGGHESGRYGSVHGQPVRTEQHPVHREPELLAGRQAVHPEDRVPGVPRQRAGQPRPGQRQGAVGQSIHPQHQAVLLVQVAEQQHMVAAGDQCGVVPEPRPVARGHEQARRSPGHRPGDRPHARSRRSARVASSRRPTRPAWSRRRSRSTSTAPR